MIGAGPGRSLALIILASAGACGDEASRGRALADDVARDFRKKCEGSPAPDAAMRRHLAALCACGEAKIAATPMSFEDSDAAIAAKVEAAAGACLAEVGGAPGEGRPPLARPAAEAPPPRAEGAGDRARDPRSIGG